MMINGNSLIYRLLRRDAHDTKILMNNSIYDRLALLSTQSASYLADSF